MEVQNSLAVLDRKRQIGTVDDRYQIIIYS